MEKIFEYDFTSNGKYHVELYNNRIEITAQGMFNLLTKGMTGTIIIPINKISAIEYTGGLLEFVVSGMGHHDSDKDKIGSDNIIAVGNKEDALMLRALKGLICDLL